MRLLLLLLLSSCTVYTFPCGSPVHIRMNYSGNIWCPVGTTPYAQARVQAEQWAHQNCYNAVQFIGIDQYGNYVFRPIR